MSATEPRRHDLRCDECGEQPRLEIRELIGCVVSCDCRTQTLQGNYDLPEGWE